MRLAVLLVLSTGMCFAAATTACGSNGAQDLVYGGNGGGAVTAHSDGGDAEPSSATPNGATAGGDASADGAQTGSTQPETGPVTLTLLNTSITTSPMGSAIAGYDPIPNHSVIDEAQVGDALSVRADTTLTVGSIEFTLDGAHRHSEDTAPYTLCGDDGNGTVTNCNLGIGPHILTATTYSDPGAGGDAGASMTISFTLIDSNAPPDASAE